MREKRGMSGLLAAAAVVVLAACGGDAGDQEMPADDADAPAAQPSEPAPAPTGGAGADLPEGVTQEMVAAGEPLFNQGICASCHGANGVGTTLGPALNDQEWLNIDGTYESIVANVQTGVPSPVQFPAPMPPMGGAQLSDEQVRQVSAYVYSLSRGG